MSAACTRLVVTNLGELDVDGFATICSRFGKVLGVGLIADHAAGLVEYETRTEAERAFDGFNSSSAPFQARFAIGQRWLS